MNSGIYKIENLVTNKIYIGSSINISKRWSWHRIMLDNNKHFNNHLQSSWNLYGDFSFSIIENCNPDKLIEREQHYIDMLNPEYNIRKIANSNLGMTFSDETRSRMSDSQKGKIISEDQRARISETLMGHDTPADVREKISNTLRGNINKRGHIVSNEGRKNMSDSAKGKVISEQARKKISASLKGRKKSPETIARMCAAQIKSRHLNNEH